MGGGAPPAEEEEEEAQPGTCPRVGRRALYVPVGLGVALGGVGGWRGRRGSGRVCQRSPSPVASLCPCTYLCSLCRVICMPHVFLAYLVDVALVACVWLSLSVFVCVCPALLSSALSSARAQPPLGLFGCVWVVRRRCGRQCCGVRGGGRGWIRDCWFGTHSVRCVFCVCVCAAAAEPAATGFDFMSGAAPAEGAEEAGTPGKLRSDSTPTAPAAEARAG